MYRFEFDEDRLLLSITMKGYWTEATFDAFAEEYLALAGRIRASHGKFRILSDTSAFEVQSAYVRASFGEMGAKLAAIDSGRTAIVTSTMLNKMQAASVSQFANFRVFMNRDEALEWLFSEGSLN